MEPEAAGSESKYAKSCAMLPPRIQNFGLTSCEIDPSTSSNEKKLWAAWLETAPIC